MMVRKKVRRQILSNVPVMLLVISGGFGAGWTAAALYHLKISNFRLTTEECGWIGSVSYFGRIVGPFLTTLLIDNIGRTKLLSLCALSFFLQWSVLFCFKTVASIILCRLVFGVTLGVLQSTVPVYMAENCSPRVRGNLMTMTMFGIYFGSVAGIFLILYVDYYFAVFGLVSLISTIYLKETPQYLILKNEIEKAKKTYFWLTASESKESEDYFTKMKQNVTEEKSKSSIRTLLKSSYIVNSLKIVSIYNIFMFTTGFAAINTFAPLLITSEPAHVVNIMMLAFSVLPAIGSWFSCFFVDSFNRKTLLYIGCLSIIFVHLSTVILYLIDKTYRISKFSYLIFLSLSIYSTIFSMTIYPIGNCLQGELLTQSAKPLGSALGVSLSSFTGFIVSNYFLQFSEHFGMASSFFVFAVFTFVMLVYVYLELPETRGKTLLDIQKELKSQDGIADIEENLL